MKEEGKKKLEEAIELLSQIASDRSVPRNSKEIVSLAKKKLEDESEDKKIRINTAIQMLDEVTNDPNLSSFIRTKVWSIVSLLESA